MIRGRENNSTPPLWVWFAVLLLLFSLLGISLPLSHKIRLDHFNLSRLNAFKQTHGKKTIPKIVVIGTSLTRNAFYKDEVMEQFAAARGKPIHFLRLTESAGDLYSFREIADLVIEAAPDVICFEAALFTLSIDSHKGMDWQERIADHRFLLKEFFRECLLVIPCFDKFFAALNLPGHNHGNFTDIDFTPEGDSTHGDFTKEKALAAEFRVRDFSERKIYHDFFKAAAKRGVRIVFIDLSRSKDKWDALPPALENNITALMNQYRMIYGITYIGFPYRLSLDYFSDYVHFGDKGREFYSRWFVDQLPIILSRESK